jgi:hypothetical protein
MSQNRNIAGQTPIFHGKVFMYTIFGAANVEPREDGFVYQIQDRDGDGIFETLLSGGQDVIVPNWVLHDRKRK